MAAKSKTKKGRGKKPDTRGTRLYTLDIELVDGPVTKEFDEENPTVSRAIQIRGNQTLEDLHWAIFDAFDRDEEHLYEFQFGSRPNARKHKRYALPMDLEDPWLDFDAEEPAQDLTRTTIESLGLRRRMRFWYWFDFGDDWWHRIEMVDVGEPAPRHKYPKVVKRVGKSPPQYPNWDEDD